MKALIIEDEKPAARHLISILQELGNIEVINILDSIKSSVHWLENNTLPDLVFMDIHIADGSAFKIFEHFNITCPIIFTTAYDEYAIKAFKVNSIDYLLKPITKEAVEKSLAKLKTLSSKNDSQLDIKQLINSLKQEKSYKSHFLVAVKGNKMVPLLTKEIAFFCIDSGKVIAVTFDEKTFNLDFNLDELASKLNPTEFYRANRQFIISKSAVKDVDLWFNNRLSINLKVTTPEKILVSRTRVTEFREWFAGE
ncbi:MAG TPA: LytTR family DNA-binding domain-containing protein [Draconibacterium sp.]|nr:LytTR family DNA-binding domain-containing protein [Draconibacterium sp.]